MRIGSRVPAFFTDPALPTVVTIVTIVILLALGLR
jgi:hypothetical protein